MWQELPTQAWSGFAMNVTEQPVLVRDLLGPFL